MVTGIPRLHMGHFMQSGSSTISLLLVGFSSSTSIPVIYSKPTCTVYIDLVRRYSNPSRRFACGSVKPVQLLNDPSSCIRRGMQPAESCWVSQPQGVQISFGLSPVWESGGCSALNLHATGLAQAADMELEEARFKGQERSKACAGAQRCTQGTGVPGSPPVLDQHAFAPVLLGTGLSQPLRSRTGFKTCCCVLTSSASFLLSADLDPGKQLGFAGSWARERRDRGLDAADARLSQWHDAGVQGTGSSGVGDVSPDTFLDGSWMAELEGHHARCPRGDASPVPWEERCWGLAQLLGSQPSPGDRSSSSSICTEDFAARFWEGMVEPLLFSEEDEDEPTGDVPIEGDDPGQDESLFPAGRRPNVQRLLAVEPGRHPLQGRSPSLMRRESLESLGGRISRLSQSDALGMAWGGPWPARSAQPALGREDSPQQGPCSREDLSAIALRSEDLAAGRPWRALGTLAGRTRAGARRGSPDVGLPGASGAGTRGHPASKSLGPRQQEPSALQGQRGGDVTLAVDDVEKEGAGSRQRRAPCLAHRAVPTQQRDPLGDVEPGEMCHPAQEERLSPSGSVGSRKPSRPTRAGLALLAHTQDACRRDPTDLRRMGQRDCVDCRERLEKERRKTSALQEEKLELQKRLRELEHRTRSLLWQRQEALDKLHVLLQKEKVDALRQLQEALEQRLLPQERAGGSARLRARLQRLEHLLSHPCRQASPWELAVPGQARSSSAARTTSVCPCWHNPLPDNATWQGPSLAAVSHALHVLRCLQEQIQHHLGQLQREEGAQGITSWREKEHEQRQLPQRDLEREQLCMEKAAAPGALKEQLIQASARAEKKPGCHSYRYCMNLQWMQLESSCKCLIKKCCVVVMALQAGKCPQASRIRPHSQAGSTDPGTAAGRDV
ncbi:uncharacterized protein M6G45_011678 [Spheniscus humboldti]